MGRRPGVKGLFVLVDRVENVGAVLRETMRPAGAADDAEEVGGKVPEDDAQMRFSEGATSVLLVLPGLRL